MLEDIEKYLNKNFVFTNYRISLVTGKIAFYNDFYNLGFVSRSLENYIKMR